MINRRRAFTIVELSAVIVIFIVILLALAPLVNMIRRRAQIIDCANNLRKLSLGLHLYAADNDGNFPRGIGDLYPAYVKDEKVFDCPASKRIGTAEKPDYIYTAGLTERSALTEAIAYDVDGNHKKHGRNILRIGGSVDWSPKSEGKPR